MRLRLMIPTMTKGYKTKKLRITMSDVHGGVICKMEGYLPKVQRFYENATDADILGIIHDDLTILEDGWEEKILNEFSDPAVAVCGFGGARGVGHPDIYKTPYHYTQLARSGFISNMVDAEKHGERVTVPTDVAFLDSMALFIRREFLASIGGWPVDRYAPSHMSDLWICLQAIRHGLRVRMVPISIEHTSGGAGPDYPEWCKTTKWGSDAAMHQHNHRMIYEEFADMLPLEVR